MTHRWAAVISQVYLAFHKNANRGKENRNIHTHKYKYTGLKLFDGLSFQDSYQAESEIYAEHFFCNSKSISPVLNVWDFSFLFLLNGFGYYGTFFFFFLTFDGFYFSLCVHITYNSYNVTLIHNFDLMQHFHWINCWMHTQINRNCVGRKSTNKKKSLNLADLYTTSFESKILTKRNHYHTWMCNSNDFYDSWHVNGLVIQCCGLKICRSQLYCTCKRKCSHRLTFHRYTTKIRYFKELKPRLIICADKYENRLSR